MKNGDSRLTGLLEMLKAEPEDIFLNYALAMEYLRLPDVGKAIAQLEKVIGIDAAYVPAYYQLGKALELSNRNTEALENYRKGRQLALAKNDRKSSGEFEEAIFLLED